MFSVEGTDIGLSIKEVIYQLTLAVAPYFYCISVSSLSSCWACLKIALFFCISGMIYLILVSKVLEVCYIDLDYIITTSPGCMQFPIFADILVTNVPTRNMLIGIYIPYLIIPLIMLARLAPAQYPFTESVSLSKVKKEE
jgi:hypothetical protein